MSQQTSIRSFFQPRSQPKYAAPPNAANSAPPLSGDGAQTTSQLPPTPPPLPPQAQAEPSSAPTPILPADLPVLAPPPSLPSQASIVPITAAHIPALRRINSLLLPVAYPDSFYTRALDPSVSGLLSRIILWQDDPATPAKVIGGIVCRLEPNPFLSLTGAPQPLQPSPRGHQPIPPPNTPYHAIYIQSLALLSPYRSQGLASSTLEHIIATASLATAIDIRTIYAHVWTENAEGLKWYEARGFRREGPEPVQGYYFKLRPDTAWIMQRSIGLGAPPPPPASSPSQALFSSQNGTAISINGGPTAAAVNLPPIGEGPPRRPPLTTSSSSTSSLSFQNARPETEWNDLPADMVAGGGGARLGRGQLLSPTNTSAPGSTTSSRSSSAVRKKRDRAYPSAAFGS